MLKKRWLLFLFLLMGCERAIPMAEYQCDLENQEKRASFLLQCIENANPLEEESPEDWILACEEVTTRLYCKRVKGFRLWGSTMTGFIPCTQAQTEEEKAACL